jgi:eukaryotic-like serine/threonine-protein kinase
MTSPVVTERRKLLYEFADFRVDPVKRILLRGGIPVLLTPKAFSVLLALIARPGQVVEKDDLIQLVWPDTFVTDANLTQNVSALRKALGERTGNHLFVVTVPGRGYSFAAPVAQVEVADDPTRSSGAIRIPVLEEPVAPAPAPAPVAPARAPSRRRLQLAVAAVVLALAAVPAWWLARSRPRPAGGASSPSRTSIAILEFKNLSERADVGWLATALPEMLITEIETGGKVRAISGETVARARSSLGLQPAEEASEEALGRLRGILGADRVVFGSYVVVGERGKGKIRLDLRLEKPDGELLAPVVATGNESDLFDLVSRTGAQLRRTLGLAELSPRERGQAAAMRPATTEAARLFALGLARLRAFDPPGALGPLQKAAAVDPGSAPIRCALSRTWSALGSDARAVDEAARAVALSQPLERQQRLEIEGRYFVTRREWGRASEIYRSLSSFFPDDVEYGLELVATLTSAGRNGEAAAAVAALRKLSSPAGDDPRIDLAEAKNARQLSDYAAQKRAAEAAARKGRRSGESLVVAQALVLEANALQVTGQSEEAIRLLQEAQALFERAGHRWAVGMTLANLGYLLKGQGDLDGTERAWTQALDIARQLGSAYGTASQLCNLGLLHEERGEVRQALALLEQARAAAVPLGDRVLQANTLNAIAAGLRAEGDFKGALGRAEEASVLGRETGNRSQQALALHNFGLVLAARGELERARQDQEQAFVLLHALGDRSLAAVMLAASADAAAAAGDLAMARRRYAQALTTKRQTGDRVGTGAVLGDLARLALRTGDLAAARASSDEQLRVARPAGARSLEVAALGNLGRAALAAGDLAGAHHRFAEALQVSTATGQELEATRLRLEQSRLALETGDAAEAARLARESAAWFYGRQIPAGEARAWALVAEAQLRLGRREQVREAAERARAQAERSGDRELRFAVVAAAARVEAAGGEAARVIPELSQSAAAAAKAGFLPAALELRLALGEIQLAAGDRGAGRTTLEAVRQEAAAHGLGLLARRAERALAGVRPEPANLL